MLYSRKAFLHSLNLSRFSCMAREKSGNIMMRLPSQISSDLFRAERRISSLSAERRKRTRIVRGLSPALGRGVEALCAQSISGDSLFQSRIDVSSFCINAVISPLSLPSGISTNRRLFHLLRFSISSSLSRRSTNSALVASGLASRDAFGFLSESSSLSTLFSTSTTREMSEDSFPSTEVVVRHISARLARSLDIFCSGAKILVMSWLKRAVSGASEPLSSPSWCAL